MPNQVEWLIENRIMLSYLWGQVTVEDFRLSNEVTFELAQGVAHDLPVHTILDGRNMTKLPNMREMLGIKFKQSRNTGWVVMILSTNRLYKFMGSTFSQILGFHFHLVESWSDAVSFLGEVDPTLPDLAHLPGKMEHFSASEE